MTREMEKKGMLVGEKGVKYGLQRPAAPAPKAKPSIFGADSDSEEDVGTQVARQADKKRAAAKVRGMLMHAWTCIHGGTQAVCVVPGLHACCGSACIDAAVWELVHLPPPCVTRPLPNGCASPLGCFPPLGCASPKG